MKIFLGLILALLLPASLVAGASAQDLPGLNEQQRLLERFDDARLPKSTFDEEGSRAGTSMTRAEAEQHRFTLGSIKFPGMKLYDADDIGPLYSDMLGTEISLADILDLAKTIERKYAQDGYASARVLLKELPRPGGKVTFLVLEGR